MLDHRLAAVHPFEICSIRPPTENYSLTFRLTRNCYWNKCAFCPVYKTGLSFSRRPLEEVKADITSAAMLNDLLEESGLDEGLLRREASEGIAALAGRIRKARLEAGFVDRERSEPLADSRDPRMKWFSSWFIDYPDMTDCLEHLLTWRRHGEGACFLGDADSLILQPDYIHEALSHIRRSFPGVRRFTIYGRTRTAAEIRSPDELRSFRRAGIDRVHFGIESGSAAVLDMVNKGETPDHHVEGARKASEAGLSSSFYVMPGLGGADLWEDHARETARVINLARPDYVRLRTLEVFEGTPLGEMRNRGEFVEADDDLVVLEIRKLIEGIDAPLQLLSDSATNLLEIYGTLPGDREAMLAMVDGYLSRSPRNRLEYSLRSRLQSFLGQYGGLSREVLQAIEPVIDNNRLDFNSVSGEEIKEMTAFVKSRLMP